MTELARRGSGSYVMAMARDDDIRNHVAGATVLHASPFADIDVPSRRDPLPEAFARKWIDPFYLLSGSGLDCERFIANLRPVYDEIDEALVVTLLSQCDWRPRITGAYFAAVMNFTSLDDHIGRLLLRSDVCYAGWGYCLALARFDTAAASSYLTRYLDYYLGRNDLWFDQGTAMAALGHLDRERGTNVRDEYLEAWRRFVENKTEWDLAREDAAFEASYAGVLAVASALGRSILGRRDDVCDVPEGHMVLDDASFWIAVKELRALAMNSTELSELLEFVKERAGKGQTVLACAIFHRAFDLPMAVASSLGAWTRFEAEFGNRGRTAEELEAEYGDLIRAHARRRRPE